MTDKIKILAISGSIRQGSSNHLLIEAIAKLFESKLEITLFESLSELPHFSPDFNDDNTPTQVTAFRQQLCNADGVLICTPEYAHGVPGSLKNAIDWTVASAEFSHKPTVLITASTDGRFGHQALLETLKVIEAENIESLQLLIQFVRTKIGADKQIKDEKVLDDVTQLIHRFINTIIEKNNS